MQNELIILTNDPSFTAWGWSIIQNQKVIACGCIKTEPEHKKKRIRKSDDTSRRIHDINSVLLSLIEYHKVNYILSEAPHGSQNASAAVMVGAVNSIIQTIADCKGIPLEWYSEDDAKKTVFGKKSVSKTEMVKAMKNIFPETVWSNTKYKDEAVADSLAIYFTARKHSQVIQMFDNKGENVPHQELGREEIPVRKRSRKN